MRIPLHANNEDARMAPSNQLGTTRRRIVWGCSILGVIAFVVWMCSTAGPFRSVSGQGVSAAEANRKLWTNRVPASATDVWFVSSYKATRIDCKLDRDEFLAWCRAKGWKPNPIIETNGTYLERLNDAVLIDDGLEFNARERGRGSSGIYDDLAGRAYIFYAG